MCLAQTGFAAHTRTPLVQHSDYILITTYTSRTYCINLAHSINSHILLYSVTAHHWTSLTVYIVIFWILVAMYWIFDNLRTIFDFEYYIQRTYNWCVWDILGENDDDHHDIHVDNDDRNFLNHFFKFDCRST